MENIDITNLLKYIYKRKLFIIISLILGLLFGGIYYKYSKRIIYSSEAKILVLTDESRETLLYECDVIKNYSKNLTVNRDLIQTYSEIIKSRTNIEDTIKELKLKTNYKEIYNNINVTTSKDKGLISITIKSDKNEDLKKILNTLIDKYITNTDNILKNNNTTILIIDNASNVESTINLNIKKVLIITTIFTFGLSLCIILLLYYLDKTLRTEQEIKNICKNKIIGYVDNDLNKSLKILSSIDDNEIISISAINNENINKIINILENNVNNKCLFIHFKYNETLNDYKTNNNIIYIDKDKNNISKILKKYRKTYNKIIIINEPILTSSMPFEIKDIIDKTYLFVKINLSKSDELKKSIELLNIHNAHYNIIVDETN